MRAYRILGVYRLVILPQYDVQQPIVVFGIESLVPQPEQNTRNVITHFPFAVNAEPIHKHQNAERSTSSRITVVRSFIFSNFIELAEFRALGC